MHRDPVVDHLRRRLPALLAVHAFGSRVTGGAGPQSDTDLAVLVEGRADPVALWELAGELEDVVGGPVDLLDLRAASTVMQHQVLTTGQRWWARDATAGLWEAAMLSEMTELETARAGLIDDILKRGTVHGR